MRKRSLYATFAVLFAASPAVATAGAVPDVGPVATHEIDVSPWGPSQETIDATRARLKTDGAVQSVLRGTRHRLLSFELVDSEQADGRDDPPSSYRATFFDYTHNRAYVATGRFEGHRVQITETQVQPEPSEEEFKEAVRLLTRDSRAAAGLRDGTLTAYQPMPPLINGDLPVSQVRRTVAVGLALAGQGSASDKKGGPSNEIVGVDMSRGRIVQFKDGAPATAIAVAGACGAPNANQSTTSRGTAGQFNVVIRRGGVELWNFVVVRPSASTGTRGSGVELRNINYRGKRVLVRASVPILNVKYEQDRCGPFRDWQWQEGSFVANGTSVASGVRRATSAPTTILETGTDTGNFRGVAFFDSGTDVTLLSELQAGWYRYIFKWVLKDDGVIQPRMGFGGVNNSCVCNAHNHHAYWRFNFDVVQGSNNSVCLGNANGTCTPITTERRLTTLPTFLEVRNVLGNEGYRLVPGTDDGPIPDAYARATAWVLAFASGQNDDGVNCTSGSSCPTDIQIDRFVNGQSTSNRDVVVWYRASFLHHDPAAGTVQPKDHGGMVHVVGPELRPISW